MLWRARMTPVAPGPPFSFSFCRASLSDASWSVWCFDIAASRRLFIWWMTPARDAVRPFCSGISSSSRRFAAWRPA